MYDPDHTWGNADGDDDCDEVSVGRRRAKAVTGRGVNRRTAESRARKVEVNVPEDLTRDDMITAAVEHYNSQQLPEARSATNQAPEPFLARISYNWLLHQCTTYDDVRHPVAADDETLAEVRLAILRRVGKVCGKRFPWLREIAARRVRDAEDHLARLRVKITRN